MKPLFGLVYALTGAAFGQSETGSVQTPPTSDMLRLAQRMTREAPQAIADGIRTKCLATFQQDLRKNARGLERLLQQRAGQQKARGDTTASDSEKFVGYYMLWQMLDQDCRILERQKALAEPAKKVALQEIEYIKAHVDLTKYPRPKSYVYPALLPRLPMSQWEYVPFKAPQQGGLEKMDEAALVDRYIEAFLVADNADAEADNDKIRTQLVGLRSECIRLFKAYYSDVVRSPKW